MLILTLNLGSTSSKVAVYENENEKFTETIRHNPKLLAEFKKPANQYNFRKKEIFKVLETAGYNLKSFDAVCSRAGLLRSIESGTYLIDKNVIADAQDENFGGRQPHGLGLVIAEALANEYGIPAFFCDPVSTDEFTDVARVTGFNGMERISRFHALNQKAIARQTAKLIGKPYEGLNLIGIHMGGGVSVAAHCKGRCIDVFDCSEEGCFSMDRAGNLPTNALIDYCFSGLSQSDIKSQLKREAGVFSYMGTSDFREVEQKMLDGDPKAKLIFDAMAYQHAKCVGAMAAVLKFKVDGIFFTGGIIYSKLMCSALKEYIGELAPIYEFPGEDEMRSLASAAFNVLNGKIEARTYPFDNPESVENF